MAQLTAQIVSHDEEFKRHVARLVRSIGVVTRADGPGQLADLLDEPPERPVQAPVAIAIEIGAPDDVLELGDLHGMTSLADVYFAAGSHAMAPAVGRADGAPIDADSDADPTEGRTAWAVARARRRSQPHAAAGGT